MNVRMDYPATQRNREPIAEVLAPLLAGVDRVLEIASGTGQHVAYFAQRFPHVRFIPSDPSAEARASIPEWVAESGVTNVEPPLAIDASQGSLPFPDGDLPFIYCANMIHIAPWSACEGLMTAAGKALAPGGTLLLYGPFKRNGEHTAESNARFDADLRSRNPSWGVRDLNEVAALADAHGLTHEDTVAMPANNLCVSFRKQAGAQ